MGLERARVRAGAAAAASFGVHDGAAASFGVHDGAAASFGVHDGAAASFGVRDVRLRVRRGRTYRAYCVENRARRTTERA